MIDYGNIWILKISKNTKHILIVDFFLNFRLGIYERTCRRENQQGKGNTDTGLFITRHTMYIHLNINCEIQIGISCRKLLSCVLSFIKWYKETSHLTGIHNESIRWILCDISQNINPVYRLDTFVGHYVINFSDINIVYKQPYQINIY